MPARLTHEVAAAQLLEQGYEALDTYPGGRAKWAVRHLVCGSEVEVFLPAVKKGYRTSCGCDALEKEQKHERIGATRKLNHESAAVDRMKDSGWEPLEPYPGSKVPWRCRCTDCGTEGSPMLQDLHRRKGCHTCSGWQRVTAERAAEVMIAAGWRPVEDFPGPKAIWACVCITCGYRGNPQYARTNTHKTGCPVCAQRAVAKARLLEFEPAAVELMMSVQLQPLEPYPGSHEPWLCRCLLCGASVTSRHGSVASSGSEHKGCPDCRREAMTSTMQERWAAEADRRVRSAGYTPLEPYPGIKRAWSCVCRCGRKTAIWTAGVDGGSRGCRACTEYGFKLERPSVTYLLKHEGLAAIKVGVTAVGSTRLNVFRRHGWQAVHQEIFDTGFGALAAEKEILDWWRNDLGLPVWLSADDMPVRGSTETAELEMMPAHIAVGRLLESAARVRAVVGVS
jgi:hypothetical protein